MSLHSPTPWPLNLYKSASGAKTLQLQEWSKVTPNTTGMQLPVEEDLFLTIFVQLHFSSSSSFSKRPAFLGYREVGAMIESMLAFAAYSLVSWHAYLAPFTGSFSREVKQDMGRGGPDSSVSQKMMPHQATTKHTGRESMAVDGWWLLSWPTLKA